MKPLNFFLTCLVIAFLCSAAATTANAADPNLVAWWKFDGDAKDSSGYANHGTVYGAQWITGKIAGALSFDGVDDYVETTTLNNIDEPITISVWIKAEELNRNQTIFGRNGKTGGAYYYENFLFIDATNMVRFGDRPGSGYPYVSSISPIEKDKWYHIAVTRASACDIRLYVNGVLENSGCTNDYDNAGINYRIGTINTGHYPFKGKLDDVRVHSRALSAGEVWQLCKGTLPDRAFSPSPRDGAAAVPLNTVLSWVPGKDMVLHDVYFGTDFEDVNDADRNMVTIYQGPTNVNEYTPPNPLEYFKIYYWRIDEVNQSGHVYKGDVWQFRTVYDPKLLVDANLVAWWKFDEGSGTVAHDWIGGNHGTVYGAAWTTGKIGGGLSFDGVNDYVETTTLNDIDQPITISVWIKAEELDRVYTVFGRNRDIHSAYYYENVLFIDATNMVRFGDRSGSDAYVCSTGPIEKDKWYHIAVTRASASNVKLYINGVLDNSGSTVDYDNSGINYRIGTINTGHYPFKGKIDDVRVYNRALSAGEVWQLCEGTLPHRAFSPSPRDGARGVPLDGVLSWWPGKNAVWHDVYFGTDFNDVNDANTTITWGAYKGRRDTTLYDPNGLDEGQTYYWRIDEVNDANIDSPWRGNIWSFKTITFHYVDVNGYGDFQIIQEAINAAWNGDIIIVRPGTYTGAGNRDIDFLGKAITVKSESGATNCIIDCQAGESDLHRGFIFQNDEGQDSVVSGLTITNGYAEYGGAIYCVGSSGPTIRHCTIVGNTAYEGGGICIRGASFNPVIEHCVIVGNCATARPYSGGTGGGILLSGCPGGRLGSGCHLCFSYPRISNCTIAYNLADGSGGGVCSIFGCAVTINNSIVWGNTANRDNNIGICLVYDACNPRFTVSHSNVKDGLGGIHIYYYVDWGPGNIDSDPCFADPCNGDYRLRSEAGRWDPNGQTWVQDNITSFCIDMGDPESDWTAELWPHGKRINMGAYGGTPQASMSLSNVGNIADFDNDGFVENPDIMLFTDKWLYQQLLLSEDLNRNGIVNFIDFAVFGNNWQSPPRPDQASNPNPANGATRVSIDANLSWTAGSNAVSHDVYFGSKSPGTFRGNQTATTFDPGTMTMDTMYYWRIDEVNPNGTTTGGVWRFRTGVGPR